MDRHPANGDPLTERTVNVPKGLPTTGNPPYTWEDVAEEELAEIARPESGEWTMTMMLRAAERYNGLGYYRKGKRSPYLVAGTSLEQPGKYIRDGVFDPRARSSQAGALAIWMELEERDEAVP